MLTLRKTLANKSDEDIARERKKQNKMVLEKPLKNKTKTKYKD